jgi:hypothetical protein
MCEIRRLPQARTPPNSTRPHSPRGASPTAHPGMYSIISQGGRCMPLAPSAEMPMKLARPRVSATTCDAMQAEKKRAALRWIQNSPGGCGLLTS